MAQQQLDFDAPSTPTTSTAPPPIDTAAIAAAGDQRNATPTEERRSPAHDDLGGGTSPHTVDESHQRLI